MKLQKDAKIFTADGKELGHLTRFVLDPRSKNVTDIVFARGMLAKDEFVLPMRLVDYVDETGIHLSAVPESEVDVLSPFKEDEYIITDEQAVADAGHVTDDMARSYYYYPPLPLGLNRVNTAANLFTNPSTGTPLGNPGPGVPVSGNSPVVKEPQENIPQGTVSVKEGSRVYSSDGKHIGNVDRLLVDSDSGRVTNLVIAKGVLLKEHKQIPVDWIADIIEDEVRLAMDAAFISRLPDYQEK